MNKITISKTNKNKALHITALLALALAIFVLPFTATAFAGVGYTESEEPENSKGVQGGAFEVTDYDLTAEVGKDTHILLKRR